MPVSCGGLYPLVRLHVEPQRNDPSNTNTGVANLSMIALHEEAKLDLMRETAQDLEV